MLRNREKFVVHIDSEIVSLLRELAQQEGRQVQALVEEGLADLIEKHKNVKLRPDVLNAYLASNEKYNGLYKKLAE